MAAAIMIALTRSQQMALIDVLVEHVRAPASTQLFIDCATGTHTSVGDLLTLITEASAPPTVTMQQLLDAKLNGFALELLSESLAGKKDIKTFKPLSCQFRGVLYTFQPAPEAT